MEWFSENENCFEEIMMDQEQIRIYYDLMKLGMSIESIKLLPGAPKCFWKIDGAHFILETFRGKYALWLVSKGEPRLQTEMELLHLLKKKQIEGFLYPVRLKNNNYYGVLKDGGFFYLTHWPELRRISYRSDINSLLSLIINFRTVVNSSDFSGFQTRTLQKSLIDRYQDMIRSMKSFATLAGYRLNPTRFDQLFLQNWEGFIAEAEQALKLIRSSTYLKVFAKRESLRPIINNFSRRNFRALINGQAICLSIKDSLLDIPLMDVALFMAKTGRANRWSREWYDQIIETYNNIIPMADEDLEIIRAYLAFPWEPYRLAARYYYNLVNWPVSAFVEKMERILLGEEARQKLIQKML